MELGCLNVHKAVRGSEGSNASCRWEHNFEPTTWRWHDEPADRSQEEILRKAVKKYIPSYRTLCQKKECIDLHSSLSFFPFPPSQAPLNNEWKLSKCIYNVPLHGPVNLTWQFSDERMIWTGMCRRSWKLIYRIVLILIFGKISCSALLAKVNCLRD